MGHSLRREADMARLRARENKLRLVMEMLGNRQLENERRGDPAPPGLQRAIADFGAQLHDVHRRQAALRHAGGHLRDIAGVSERAPS